MSKDRSEIYLWLARNKVPEAELLETAERFRNTYISRRKAFYPDYHMESEVYEDIDAWTRLAMMLWTENANPQDFITAQFEKYPSIPPPRAIMGPRGVEVYKAWKKGSEGAFALEAANTLKLSVDKLLRRREQYAGSGRTDKELLTDVGCQCDALFTYCQLMAAGFPEEAQAYRKLARALLLKPGFREAYAAVFKNILEYLK